MNSNVIFKDEKRIAGKIDAINRLSKDTIEHLGKMLSEQGIKMDNDVLSSFLSDAKILDQGSNGYLEKTIRGIVEHDIGLLPIKSKEVRNKMTAEAMQYGRQELEYMRKAINDAFFGLGIGVSDFEVKNGKASISESGKKRIEEKYTVVLEAQSDKDLWSGLVAICNQLNLTEKAINSRGNNSITDLIIKDSIWLNFTRGENGEVFIEPNPRGFLMVRGIID